MRSKNFEYQRPEGVFYKLSAKDYNANFAKRGNNYFSVVEVYVEEDEATLIFRPSLFGKCFLLYLSPAIYPMMIIKHGYEETHRAYKDLVFDKKRGAFSVDRFYRKNHKSWSKLMSLLED